MYILYKVIHNKNKQNNTHRLIYCCQMQLSQNTINNNNNKKKVNKNKVQIAF